MDTVKTGLLPEQGEQPLIPIRTGCLLGKGTNSTRRAYYVAIYSPCMLPSLINAIDVH